MDIDWKDTLKKIAPYRGTIYSEEKTDVADIWDIKKFQGFLMEWGLRF